MAPTSGFFVPPTVRTPARPVRSQNLVAPIGVMPHARSVSVAEGTRLTTRGMRPERSLVMACPSKPVEELGLLGVELGLADHAPLAQLVQLLELLGYG